MLTDKHELGIFELGISEPGEMDVLKSMTQPTHVIITNISTAHIENFENKSQLVKEKEKLIIKNLSLIHI